MARIEHIVAHRLKLPLAVSYELAFGTIRHFDTILIEARDADGTTGYGEATVLTGYTHETIDRSWKDVCTLARQIVGLCGEEAVAHLEPHLKAIPFTVTALSTAVEMLNGAELLRNPNSINIPLLALVDGHDAAALETEIDRKLSQGYRTLKVKVGFDVDKDLARVHLVQSIVSGRARIRIDANQGYDQTQACRFAAQLNPRNIELLEQTCAADDWTAAQAVAKVTTIPLMLDESIYSIDDVDRAADLNAASLIKFKLMKAGSVRKLLDALQHIRDLGMQPVLGNGVAADIGCWMEARIADGNIYGAGEMNGFLKIEQSLVTNPLTVQAGHVAIPPYYRPHINTASLLRYRQGVAEF